MRAVHLSFENATADGRRSVTRPSDKNAARNLRSIISPWNYLSICTV